MIMFPLVGSRLLGGTCPIAPHPKGSQFRGGVGKMITDVTVSLAKSITHPRRHGLARCATRAVTFSRHASTPANVAKPHLNLRFRRRSPAHVITVEPRYWRKARVELLLGRQLQHVQASKRWPGAQPAVQGERAAPHVVTSGQGEWM